MKKWIGFGILAGLLVIGSYYPMGLMTEKLLEKTIADLSRSQQYKIVIAHYHRGWFCSHALLNLTVPMPEALSTATDNQGEPKSALTLEIPLDISHGPVIWTHARLRLGLGYAEATARLPASIHQAIENKYHIRVGQFQAVSRIFVNFLKKTSIEFDIPPNKMTAPFAHGHFNWLGLAAHAVIAENKQQVKGGLNWQGLSWENDEQSGQLGLVTGRYDLTQALDELLVGKTKLAVNSLILKDKNVTVFGLNKATLYSVTEMKEGLFNSSCSLKFNTLAIEDQAYSDFFLDVSFKNLDATILSKMNRKIKDSEDTSDTPSLFWSLLPEVPALLSKGAQLDVNHFEVKTHAGLLKMNLSLALPNENYTNPLQLLVKIRGQSQVMMAKPILVTWLQTAVKKSLLAQPDTNSFQDHQSLPSTDIPNRGVLTNPSNPDSIDTQVALRVEKKIKEWIQQQVIIEKGGVYVIRLTIRDGMLTVNGHPFNRALMRL